MNAVNERLATLRVSDVMQREVTSVASYETLERAAAILAEHQISGAPVVDAQMRCVGVISATDFLRKEAACGRSDASLKQGDCGCGSRATFHIEASAHELVSGRMTPIVQCVVPDASLVSAARMMCDAHLHRLIVVGDDGRVAGVVSTLDILAALVGAVDEAAVAPLS